MDFSSSPVSEPALEGILKSALFFFPGLADGYSLDGRRERPGSRTPGLPRTREDESGQIADQAITKVTSGTAGLPDSLNSLKNKKLRIFKTKTSPRVRVQFLLPMPCHLWHGYRTCGNESGGVRESGAGPKVQIPKSTSPRVRWSICVANVEKFQHFGRTCGRTR